MATKEDVARMETKVAEAETRFIKWTVGAVVGSVSAASSIAFVVARLLA